jgi:hypothetical protein
MPPVRFKNTERSRAAFIIILLFAIPSLVYFAQTDKVSNKTRNVFSGLRQSITSSFHAYLAALGRAWKVSGRVSTDSSITGVAAVAASTFTQSIGVNVHMAYTWTSYADVALVNSDLAYLGMDHVRDKLESPAYVSTSVYNQLAADGIKFVFNLPDYGPAIPADMTQFISMLDSLVESYPNSVSAIEGPNEVDLWPILYNGGSSLGNDAELQRALYAAVQADAHLSSIPVYNLTLGFMTTQNLAALGNLSSDANYANIHPYANDAQSPQSFLTAFLPSAQIDAPGLPTVITETGYETNPADGYSGADQTVQAKYTLDLLVDAFLDGVSQTYLYELVDEGGQEFGLFNADGTPKLVATAIHNLTTLLADPGATSAFTPGSLSYAIPDLPGNGAIGAWVTGGQQLLLEKSNGTFDLVLWNEPTIWNPSTESEVAAPIENTTVAFATVQKTVLVFDPLVGSAPIATYENVQSISVALTDHPIVVEIPGATASLTAPTITGFASNSLGPNSGTLTGTAVANSTVLVFDGTTEIGTATANTSGTWSFLTGSLAKGANALTAMAVDPAGDVSALSVALNVTNATAGPAAPIMVPIIFDDTVTSTNQVILTGTGEANSTVSVFDTTLLGTATVNASGVWTYTTLVLVNGDNNFAVVTTDAAGNASAASNYVQPVIDLSGPTATAVVATGAGITNGNGDLNAGHVVTLTVAVSEDVTVAGGTPTLTLNDGGNATYTGGSGTNVLTFSYTVAAGQNTPALAVTAVNLNGATITDDNGNNAVVTGTLMIAGTLQIDTTTPAAPVISNDALNSNNSITLTGTATANSMVTVYEGQTELGTTSANASGTWSFTTQTLGSGAHVFAATATDAAGNTSDISNSLDPIIDSTTTEISKIYEAVVQRAPTGAEAAAWAVTELTIGVSGAIGSLVDSPDAQKNIYPIVQIIDLATGNLPTAVQLAAWVLTTESATSLYQAAAEFITSTAFASTYNNGVTINPYAPITASIIEAIIQHATGAAATPGQVNAWVSSGLTVDQVFVDFALGEQYTVASQSAVQQDLTTLANNAAGINGSGALNATNPSLSTAQITEIYQAILQRPPTSAEVSAAAAENTTMGNAVVVAVVVDSPEASQHVYPVAQIIDLATDNLPTAAQLAAWVAATEAGVSFDQVATTFVASTAFGNTYNDGTSVDPNAPITASIIEAIIQHATGVAATPVQVSAWVSSGQTIDQVFVDFALGDQYTAASQSTIEQYLTAAADNEAGLSTIIASETTGALTLGTLQAPLNGNDLTILGGSGALTVVASGAGNTITELNTSIAGGTISANGAGDSVNTANGANTITANGPGDHIDLGVISTGMSITGAQVIHAAGAGDVVTFAATAADSTAVIWAGTSTVDGGNISTGIGANDTINYGNNIGSGSETAVLTGDLTGATTSGGTSTSGISMTTLGNVIDAGGDQIVFNNATTELLAGSSAVNVASATSLAHALDLAAAAAAASQSGGTIGSHTGVIDWFQYGGNTYVVEAINIGATSAIHNALAATDEVIKIVGLVNLGAESLSAHVLTL